MSFLNYNQQFTQKINSRSIKKQSDKAKNRAKNLINTLSQGERLLKTK